MMIEREDLKFMYRKMLEIRLFELGAIKTYKQRLWKGSLHACIGQEAAPAAAAVNTRADDYFVSNHRGHGHVLGKGVEAKIFMAELFGRLEGLCRGRGGSLHAMDQEKRVFPNGLVGSGVYIAAGIGYAINYSKKDEVVVCFFGDGAANTGGFHEGINMAALWNAPVVYICENNGIGVSTKTETIMPVPNISQRALSYGIKGITVDGTDCLALYKTIKSAVQETRELKRPILIEAICHRAVGHTAWDNGEYRSDEENNMWKHYDPIQRLRAYLLAEELFSEAEIQVWENEVGQLIEEAVEFATHATVPAYTREEAGKYVFAPSNN